MTIVWVKPLETENVCSIGAPDLAFCPLILSANFVLAVEKNLSKPSAIASLSVTLTFSLVWIDANDLEVGRDGATRGGLILNLKSPSEYQCYDNIFNLRIKFTQHRHI